MKLTESRYKNIAKIQTSKKFSKTKLKNDFLINYGLFLKKLFPSINLFVNDENIYINCTSKNLWRVAQFLKLHTNAQFKSLMEICAVDYPEKYLRFEVIYHLLSTHYNSRINLTLLLSDTQTAPTLTTLYPNANWLEREVWDMFGICFTNHADLRRILTDYGFKGHPLRKDFPLTGFTETLYNDFDKNIDYQEVSLTQMYRNFNVTVE